MNNEYQKMAVIDVMTKIALKEVKHYFTDFTKFDIPQLVESGESNFLWLVRDTGTWLVNVDSQENIDWYLLEAKIKYSDEVYWINLDARSVQKTKLDFNFLKSEINLIYM